MKKYKILVINPGSTSTKISIHENEECILSTSVFHDSKDLLKFNSINDQLDYRMEVLWKFLEENHIDLTGIDAIVGRGGGCYSIESGIYTIDDQLIEDTKNCKGELYHSSMLGVQMARRVQEKYGGIALMTNPPVVDEYCDLARLTGIKGIYRKSVSHALNLKAVVKKHCELHELDYEKCNFIVCHIDGGISITAHQKGKMIDSNNAGGGEGPFSPTRMGSMAITDVINHLYGKSKEEMKKFCSEAGGLSSYFGTSNADVIHQKIDEGDEGAKLVWNTMIYQICKWIGSMSTVLEGKVDGIVLTGGLLRFPEIEETIKQRCGWIAEVYSYPGELEHEAMANTALLVLTGKEKALTYSGKPVFDGFDYFK